MTRSLRQTLGIVAATCLFIAVFPWIFACSGQFHGVSYSVRALGDFLSVAMLLLGLLLAFSSRVRNFVLALSAEVDALPEHTRRRLMAGFVALYVIGIVSHKLRAHYLLGTHTYDLGMLSNICYNTLHGRWYFSSLADRNFMAIHTHWILGPLSLLYWIHEGGSTLLVVNALFAAAAIPFVWKIAEHVLGSFSVGGLAALLFISSPFIGHSVQNDFRPDLLEVPVLCASVWLLLKSRPYKAALVALLAFLCKEDVAIVLSGYALVMLTDRRWRNAGALLLTVSIGAFLFQTQIFIPHFLPPGTKSILMVRYPMLGNSYGSMVRNLFFHPIVYWRAFLYEPTKFWRALCYLGPTGGLAALNPFWLIPSGISLMPHLLSQASTQLELADIYSLPSQAFLVLASVYGAKKFLGWCPDRFKPMMLPYLIIVCAFGIWNTPKFFHSETPERVDAFYELKRLIPPTASVAAQENIFPHVDMRQTVQIFPIQSGRNTYYRDMLVNPDYIFCDRIGNALPFDGNELRESIARLESSPNYAKVAEKENFIVFKRVKNEALAWIPN